MTTNEAPPEAAIASAEDFQHQRTAEGEKIPVWEPIPGSTETCPECDGSGVEDPDEVDSPDCATCGGDGTIEVQAEVVPIDQGDAEAYLPADGQPGNIDDGSLVVLLDEHFVTPDFDIDRSKPAGEAIKGFNAFGIEPLVMTLYNASGYEHQVNAGASMAEEHGELLQQIQGNTSAGN